MFALGAGKTGNSQMKAEEFGTGQGSVNNAVMLILVFSEGQRLGMLDWGAVLAAGIFAIFFPVCDFMCLVDFCLYHDRVFQGQKNRSAFCTQLAPLCPFTLFFLDVTFCEGCCRLRIFCEGR